MSEFQQRLWEEFVAQRPEPADPALAYNGAGGSEEKLRAFTDTPFYRRLLPESRNILRHVHRVEWLRQPQVDALELYIYLKEVRENPTTQHLYRDVLVAGLAEKSAAELTSYELQQLQSAREQIDIIDDTLAGVEYPNAIYSLAMGTGKTALMAAMIFYDFVLSWKHPDDARFAKNALVFSPDLTIIEALREIQELDRSRLLPGEYVNFLDANLKFHYLADSGAELTVLAGSTYNVIVTNVQKIILKRWSMPSDARELFGDMRRALGELVSNTRLQRLEDLDNLAVFVDEAHHSFGRSLEDALTDLGISTDKILVNHSKVDDDAVRCFRELDTADSPYQFILLVGKGTEGWNCHSLFATALYRRPHSRIFLLQSSMRCLRAIGDMPQTASVFLSTENRGVLEKEIEANLGTNMETLQRQQNRRRITIEVLKAKQVELKKPVTRIVQRRRGERAGVTFELDSIDLSDYTPVVTVTEGLDMLTRETEEVYRVQRECTRYTLVEEISRFTGLTCLEVERVLRESDVGLAGVLDYVNEENALLHDVVIPNIQDAMFVYDEESGATQETVELARNFPVYRNVSADKEHLLRTPNGGRDLSYHLDHYIFDSADELRLFEDLLSHNNVEEIYFTGGITDPTHNEFYVEYFDNTEGCWRRYFPDFYVKLAGDGWMVVEVKRSDQTEHPSVKAKEQAARTIFETLNEIQYRVKPDDQIRRGDIHDLFL